MKTRHRIARGVGLLGAAIVAGATLAGAASAATQVERGADRSRLTVDVWTNKEEGGVYRPGEGMRIFFRPSADAFVLLYNIDTDGYIHLIYPYGPDDPDRVEGGRTYQIPSRRDPYDLVADGPAGVEYVVALAAPFPFSDLPWYLSGRVGDGEAPPDEQADDDDSGVIVGDPYVGMDRIARRIVPPGREDDVATADTYFYIGERVEYPRYVCADCHSHAVYFDPYRDVCPVVEIRIDATWARFAPLRTRILRPRYYYDVRRTAPDRYRRLKDRWSTLDGRATLRERFEVQGPTSDTRRERLERRTPPEFRDLRRYRPGRFWQGRDQVLRLREQRQQDRVDQQRQGERDRARTERDRVQQDRGDQRGGNQRGGDQRGDANVRERQRPPDNGDRGRSSDRGQKQRDENRGGQKQRDDGRGDPKQRDDGQRGRQHDDDQGDRGGGNRDRGR